MEAFLFILAIVSSLASIIGIWPNKRKHSSAREKLFFGFFLAVSVLWGATFYVYKNKVDEELRIERRKEKVREEAKKLLDSAPAYISNYDPGVNEGLMLSTLLLLEQNKELFPEMYEMYKLRVSSTLQMMDKDGFEYEKRDQLEAGANMAVRCLKSLSQ